MTRNFAELERELLDDLERRTGKDLGAWMSAIRAAGLDGKNAIIDWLRPQGFTFANASWLERIHNNGGRPIYLDQPAPALPKQSRLRAEPASPRLQPEPRLAPQQASPPRAPAILPAGSPDAVAALLSRGKGLRMLAEHLLREFGHALPDLAIAADGELVLIARPRVLACLLVSPRDVRLGLDLGPDHPVDAMLQKARIPGAPASITHMLALNDARQVGPPLLDLVRNADMRANPPPPGAEQ